MGVVISKGRSPSSKDVAGVAPNPIGCVWNDEDAVLRVLANIMLAALLDD